MTITEKELDEHRCNQEPFLIPKGHFLYDIVLENDDKPCFRIYDPSGKKLFGAHYEPEQWNKLIALMNRFNERYQTKMANQ